MLSATVKTRSRQNHWVLRGVQFDATRQWSGEKLQRARYLRSKAMVGGAALLKHLTLEATFEKPHRIWFH